MRRFYIKHFEIYYKKNPKIIFIKFSFLKMIPFRDFIFHSNYVDILLNYFNDYLKLILQYYYVIYNLK